MLSRQITKPVPVQPVGGRAQKHHFTIPRSGITTHLLKPWNGQNFTRPAGRAQILKSPTFTPTNASTPMQRHPALVPLSREHHQWLVLAQVLKQDVPAYRGLPATPTKQRDYALQRYREELVAHMDWEEAILLPTVEQYSQKLQDLADRVRREHEALRSTFTRLESASPDNLAFLLDELGHLIANHVRFEEREFFQQLQTTLPETAWITIQHPSQDN